MGSPYTGGASESAGGKYYNSGGTYYTYGTYDASIYSNLNATTKVTINVKGWNNTSLVGLKDISVSLAWKVNGGSWVSIESKSKETAYSGDFHLTFTIINNGFSFGASNEYRVGLYGKSTDAILNNYCVCYIQIENISVEYTAGCRIRAWEKSNLTSLMNTYTTYNKQTVYLDDITTQYSSKPGYEVLGYKKANGTEYTYATEILGSEMGDGDKDIDIYILWGKIYRVGLYNYDGTRCYLSSEYDVNLNLNSSGSNNNYSDSTPKNFYFPVSNPSQYTYYPANSYISKTNTSPALYFIGWQYSTSNVSYNGTDNGQQPNSVITLSTSTAYNGGTETVSGRTFHLIKYYGIWNSYWEVTYKDGNTTLLNTSYTNYSNYTIRPNSDFNNNQGIESLHPEKQFLGWKEENENQIRQGGYTFSNPGRALILLAQWQDKYKVTFYNSSTKLYESDYILKNGSYTIPEDTTIRNGGIQILDNTKQFLGWSTSSTATSANYTAGGTIQNVTANITLYTVWKARASIQLKENNTLQTSTTGTYGSFTITGAAATNNGTYYYNAGTQNIQVTYTLNSTGTLAEPAGNQVYISSVATTSNLMTPDPDTNTNKAWTSKTWTATAGTSIIIGVNVARNLILDCELVYYGIPGITNSNFSIGETTTQGVYSEIDSNNSLHKYYCLRPNEQVTFNTSCASGNDDYYIKQFVYPKNITYSNTYTWTIGSQINSGGEFISTNRTDAFSSSGNPAITDSNLLLSQKSGKYTFTTNANHMSTTMDNQDIKRLYVYVYYVPYFQSFDITNTGYSGISQGNGTNLTRDYCTTDKQTYLRIFNEVTTANLPTLYFSRANNTTKHVISNIEVQEYNQISSQYEDNSYTDKWHQTFQDGPEEYCDYGGIISLLTDSSGGVVLEDCNFNNYYLNRFIGYKINSESPYSEYRKPIKINATWSDKDYKCFIVLQFIQSENSDATVDDVFNTSDNSLNSWENFNLQEDNEILFIQEITNTNITNSINAVFRDITNIGYILKEVEKYSFDGTYNSDCTSSANHKIITREQLDTNSANLFTINITRESPYINPSDSTDTSNDKLTFNKTDLNNNPGVVDYYFITYEEGLPIFYPDDDNNPKRAIQMFWENNRVIGLYYGNTRLL